MEVEEIRPSHYKMGKIEVIDFIQDHKLPFDLGNVVKYICRAPFKGTEIDDLVKAKTYLEFAIARVRKEVKDE